MKARPAIVEETRRAVRLAGGAAVAVEEIEIFSGPSPWSDEPAVVCRIAAEGGADEAETLQRRVRGQLTRLPAWQPEPGASYAGTVASLAAMVAARLLRTFGAYRLGWGAREEGEHRAALRVDYLSRAAGLQAVKTALAIVARHAAGESATVPDPNLARLRQICALEQPRVQTLIGAAKRRDVPFLAMHGDPGIWQFGWGSRSETFWQTSPNADGMVSYMIAKNKAVAKQLFRSLGIPTPTGVLLPKDQPARAAVERIGFPCVVKPLDSGGGKGVTADIRTLQQLERAVAIVRRSGKQVLVEAHVPGFDHRLMVVDGRLVAAVRRDPPEVVGDGRSTIAELIQKLNRERRALPSWAFLYQVREDEALRAHLERQRLSRDSVLAEGRRVALRSNANVSTGGTAVNVTDQVHPSVKAMAERLAAGIGLRSTGIDYVTPDIGRSHSEVGGGVIEANTSPALDLLGAAGFDFHEMAVLVLGERPGRIPARLLVTDAGKRERAFEALERAFPHDARALVTQDRGLIGGVPIAADGMNPARIVEAALRHRTVSELAIVWDRDCLMAMGLPVDRLQRIVILGAPLPDEWAEVAGRRSAEMVRASRQGEAVGLML
jgi:cyanophycin synthetase